MAPFGKGLTRVYGEDGVPHVRSLGTTDPKEQHEVEDFVRRLRRQRRWDVTALIIGKHLTVIQCYDADVQGTLGQLVKETQRRVARATEGAADPDLSPLVTEWGGRGKKARSERYVEQVRHLIPEGEAFPVSRFRTKTIKAFLDGLPVEDPTRNRYRTALSQFAWWLIEREIIETNPVKSVRGFGEHDPRMTHYTREEARALVRSLSGEARIVGALMAGTGMEWGAVEKAMRRGVKLDERMIWAEGGKNRWRKRWVMVTEDWCWEILEPHIRGLTENTPLVTIPNRAARIAHQEAADSLNLHPSTLHDWRHTYAIYSLSSGLPPQLVKRQLGHSPHSTVLERVYAAWIPRPEDYARIDTSADTQKKQNMKPRKARSR